MNDHRVTEAELDAAGLLGATVNTERDTLRFHFRNRVEVWTRVPDAAVDTIEVPSLNVVRFDGVVYQYSHLEMRQ